MRYVQTPYQWMLGWNNINRWRKSHCLASAERPRRAELLSNCDQFVRRHESVYTMQVPMISVLMTVFAFMTDAEAHNVRTLTKLIRRINPRLRPRDINVVSYHHSIHNVQS